MIGYVVLDSRAYLDLQRRRRVVDARGVDAEMSSTAHPLIVSPLLLARFHPENVYEVVKCTLAGYRGAHCRLVLGWQ